MLTVRSGSYKRKRPAKKARVPRTLAVKPADRIYRFTRTVSTNDGELNTTNIQLRTDALGHPRFYAAGAAVSGDNLQMVFSLSSFDIYLNGALTSTQNPPGYSEFTALFDEWCIEKVELFALPTFCSNDIATGTSAAQLPWIVYAEDNDDAADTPCRNLQQVAGAKYTQLTSIGQQPKPLCVLHPKPAMAAYRSATSFAYSRPSGRTWIDCANSTTPHYGFKCALDNSYSGYNTNSTYAVVNFVAKIHYAFRGVI